MLRLNPFSISLYIITLFSIFDKISTQQPPLQKISVNRNSFLSKITLHPGQTTRLCQLEVSIPEVDNISMIVRFFLSVPKDAENRGEFMFNSSKVQTGKNQPTQWTPVSNNMQLIAETANYKVYSTQGTLPGLNQLLSSLYFISKDPDHSSPPSNTSLIGLKPLVYEFSSAEDSASVTQYLSIGNSLGVTSHYPLEELYISPSTLFKYSIADIDEDADFIRTIQVSYSDDIGNVSKSFLQFDLINRTLLIFGRTPSEFVASVGSNSGVNRVKITYTVRDPKSTLESQPINLVINMKERTSTNLRDMVIFACIICFFLVFLSFLLYSYIRADINQKKYVEDQMANPVEADVKTEDVLTQSVVCWKPNPNASRADITAVNELFMFKHLEQNRLRNERFEGEGGLRPQPVSIGSSNVLCSDRKVSELPLGNIEDLSAIKSRGFQNSGLKSIDISIDLSAIKRPGGREFDNSFVDRTPYTANVLSKLTAIKSRDFGLSNMKNDGQNDRDPENPKNLSRHGSDTLQFELSSPLRNHLSASSSPNKSPLQKPKSSGTDSAEKSPTSKRQEPNSGHLDPGVNISTQQDINNPERSISPNKSSLLTREPTSVNILPGLSCPLPDRSLQSSKANNL